MKMHSSRVVFTFLFLVCSVNALPCGEAHDVGDITCPEEVILVTISEEGGDAAILDNAGAPYRISTDELDSSDNSASGEVVESAANEGVPQLSQEVPQETVNSGKSDGEAETVHVEK